MNKWLKFSVLLLGLSWISAQAMALPDREISQIANKIYQNECASKPENLLHWNQNESFASIGIWHFIWFSKATTSTDLRFEEQFPEVVRFISDYQPLAVELAWLRNKAPWSTKTEFMAFKKSAKSQVFKDWLLQTKALQAKFIVQRFQGRAKSLGLLNDANSDKVAQIFQQMMQRSKTRFALIDYVNFKGWGDNPKERYQGQGWGLLQVLEQMVMLNPSMEMSQDTLLSVYIDAGKKVLESRIKNASPLKNEEAWRAGWFKRIENYLKD